MDSKELGYLFRIAVCFGLDGTKTVSMSKPDEVSQEVISLVLKHLDLIETEDIVWMYSMIYSYFNSYSSILADNISVEDFIKTYQTPRKESSFKAFADLLMDELERRIDGNTDDKGTAHRSE